ncbi:Copine-domain-containing protein [Dunaliella salina]|uniref:Copine-domain-containing protein n=1 Tax=Dunaliella salina TaxID=3046 RepID=A0ABQ7GSH9_DUNSA|nr:Copine-domain-containing protein [Dunaliella salina]|eukprot:KAF5837566.1 Copine-domain-containing protein [Dunaliella salina]
MRPDSIFEETAIDKTNYKRLTSKKLQLVLHSGHWKHIDCKRWGMRVARLPLPLKHPPWLRSKNSKPSPTSSTASRKSNEWTGKNIYNNQNLHTVGGPLPNPYVQAITIIGRTLEAFDADQLIPVYGFGDATTFDSRVFSFLSGDQSLHRMGAVLARYNQLTPNVILAGPTSFAPAIYQAMRVVAERGYQFHILLIVADGQVTRPTDMRKGQLSNQEKATIDAIEAASHLPLSIIMVGVGDGPWEVMKDFDDALPARRFDNFQFVNFTELLQQNYTDYAHMEARFALRALMEVPEQYKKLSSMGSPISDDLKNTISKIPPPLDPPAP